MDVLTLAISIGVLLFIVRGAWRGLTGELAPLVGIIAFCGILFFAYDPLRQVIVSSFPGNTERASTFYSVLSLVLLASLIFLILTAMIRRVGIWIIPQPFNAILGGIFGALKAVLLISLFASVSSIIRGCVDSSSEKLESHSGTRAMLQFWQEKFFPALTTILTRTSATPQQSAINQTEKEHCNGEL